MALNQEILLPDYIPSSNVDVIDFDVTAPQKADSHMVLLAKIAQNTSAGGGGGTFSGDVNVTGGQIEVTGGNVNANITGKVDSEVYGIAVVPETVSYSYQSGSGVPISIDLNNGAILVNDRVKERLEDSMSFSAYQFDTCSNSTPSSGSGVVFNVNTGEEGYITNIGTGAINWKLGSGASPTSMNGVINPATTLNLAGGTVRFNTWIGPVSVSPIAGVTDIKYIAYKLNRAEV